MINGGSFSAGQNKEPRTLPSSTIIESAPEGHDVGPLNVHPGEVLLEEFMRPLDLSANRLAIALRVPSGRITDIINQKRGVSAETALRLARYFGTSADFWLNLQKSWELCQAQDQIGQDILREVQPRAA
jgi:antitoxin HigA-1